MRMISHSMPWITRSDLRSVEEVLASGDLAQGVVSRRFELAVSEWIGAKDAVGAGSGTAALALALVALDVRERDEVILPSYVCASVLEAVLHTGAKPVMCDVGENWVVTPENVSMLIGSKTKAIIIPHIFGIFADITSFRQFGIPLVEDCAQAIGRKGQRTILGDIAVLSFHATKCLTCGEGGMAASNNADLVAEMRNIRDGDAQGKRGRIFSPLSNLAAALGLSQLGRYKEFLDRREALARGYTSALEPIIPHSIPREAFRESMYFRYPLRVFGGLELYLHPFARKKICVRRGVDRLLHRLVGLPDEGFRTSVELFESTVSLPLYPALSAEEHTHCISAAMDIFSSAEHTACSGPATVV